MRTLPVVAVVLAGLTAAVPVAGQPPCPSDCPPAGSAAAGGVYRSVSAAPPGVYPPPGARPAGLPSADALARVNLRAEWATYIPLDNAADGIDLVQHADAGQVFVQTRAGRLLALDAATGARQWGFRYPKAYAVQFPVGVTDRLVFAAHVNTLYAFQRFTGLQEFAFDLPGVGRPGAGAATAGPVADQQFVYLLLGAQQVAAYRYPGALVVPAAPVPPTGAAGAVRPDAPQAGGLTDQAAERVGGRAFVPPPVPAAVGAFQRAGSRPPLLQSGSGLGPRQPTPAIDALPRVTPPYSLAREVSTPSVAVLPSLREPYRLRAADDRNYNRTPSVAVLPPSAAAANMLDSYRPVGAEPTPAWAVTAPGRVAHPPIFAPSVVRADTTLTVPQLFVTTDGPLAFSVDKATGRRFATVPLSGPVGGPATGPIPNGPASLLGYIPQADGALLAVDLVATTPALPAVVWRSNVGGLLNRKPVATGRAVYAHGDNAGVAQIDPATGTILWRTAAAADFLLAVNDEHAYVRDRRGNLLVFPRGRVADPTDPEVRPAAALPLPGFTLPVTNDQTDRILLAAPSGLLVCLRDAAAKYLRPIRVAPPPPADAPPPAPTGPAAPPPANQPNQL